MFKYELLAQDTDTKARVGVLHTDHGDIPTPIFMPVGTAGTVKAVHIKDVKDDINAKIILGNTYHLYLRPGTEILEATGGLHKFNGWNLPILTDSGGYQVYSLTHIRKITEEGVKFQSHIDGSYHFFTPEKVIDIERSIGADIIMAFDECTPFPCEYKYAEKSLKLTHNWLKRCIERYRTTDNKYGYHQELFPIVQGSVYRDLRKQSAEFVAEFGTEGNAIGGLAVGEPAEIMYELTEHVCDILPKGKARYLMGVGTPENILECISLGVDMFDCVMPTRNGRNGMLFTNSGIINIKNKKWEKDFSVIDELCPSFVSAGYSKAYVRHLFAAHEILGGMIASQHNLAFYLQLVTEAREHILAGDFKNWKESTLKTIMKRL
ncbi:MAG: tRNA guanosine(34) transglycosylase Tgt [Bacteroidales bacterium]|jgi:queuine tRNA-ribosyltransferase|nr:tRNA guanosine(34) transglycosylase Tgt [Bacteroidales bacterium]